MTHVADDRLQRIGEIAWSQFNSMENPDTFKMKANFPIYSVRCSMTYWELADPVESTGTLVTKVCPDTALVSFELTADSVPVDLISPVPISWVASNLEVMPE